LGKVYKPPLIVGLTGTKKKDDKTVDGKNKTVKEKVLEYIALHPNSKPKEIATSLNLSPAHISVVLVELKKQGKIQAPEYGQYIIVRQPIPTTTTSQTKSFQKTQCDIDLESTSTLISLRNKYGREKLINILEDWIKLMK
jgi:DNA-binding MarR family transcriptional regulator